jgi:hypothetical protein
LVGLSLDRAKPRRAGRSNEGVYLLANDGVAPWLQTCAASLRAFNPSIRVVVLAFDHDLSTVRRLCASYDLELWDDPSLKSLDGVGAAAAPSEIASRSRKLVAFWGPLKRFLYLDVDTVVLMDLAPILAAVARSPDTMWFAHCDKHGGNVEEVYRPGPWRDSFLRANGSHAGNAGVWAATRGLLSRRKVLELAEAARSIEHQFVHPDQGFLNFCLDATATPVRNLHDEGIPEIMWAGVSGCVESEGALRLPGGTPVGLIHWAGYRLDDRLPYRALWARWALSDHWR